MARSRRPPSRGWLAFLRNHARCIAAVDLFVVPTIGFRLPFGLVILNHDRRLIVHIAATYHPTAEWIACQIRGAFPWDTAPQYLIRDRDGAYGQAVQKDCLPWVSGTDPLHHDGRGRMGMSSVS